MRAEFRQGTPISKLHSGKTSSKLSHLQQLWRKKAYFRSGRMVATQEAAPPLSENSASIIDQQRRARRAFALWAA
jgi:hypothetical protein